MFDNALPAYHKELSTSVQPQLPIHRKSPQSQKPSWMLVRKGFLSRIMADVIGDGVMRKCWPAFFSREDAQSLIDAESYASGVRPAEIGSLQAPNGEESFEQQLSAAIDDGCDFMLVMYGRRDDGEIIWGITDLSLDQRWKEALAITGGRPPL